MANAQPVDVETTLIGIKYECAKQRDIKLETMEREDCLVTTLILSAFIHKEVRFIKHYINKITKSQPWAVSVSCNSKVVGVKSHIGPYTNKKGKTHMAHYTFYNHYLGPCTELGNEPIYYDGRFPYGTYKDLFEIVLPPSPSKEQLPRITLSDFVVPKIIPAEDEENDTMESVMESVRECLKHFHD